MDRLIYFYFYYSTNLTAADKALIWLKQNQINDESKDVNCNIEQIVQLCRYVKPAEMM